MDCNMLSSVLADGFELAGKGRAGHELGGIEFFAFEVGAVELNGGASSAFASWMADFHAISMMFRSTPMLIVSRSSPGLL